MERPPYEIALMHDHILRLEEEIKQLKQENDKLKEEIKTNGFGCFNIEMSEEFDKLKAENEQLKEELSAIQHNCNREGCKYYDDDTFKVFYECKAKKALQLSANSVTTKYCDLLKTLTEIKEIAEKNLNIHSCAFTGCGYDLITSQILQKISEVENG